MVGKGGILLQVGGISGTNELNIKAYDKIWKNSKIRPRSNKKNEKTIGKIKESPNIKGK